MPNITGKFHIRGWSTDGNLVHSSSGCISITSGVNYNSCQGLLAEAPGKYINIAANKSSSVYNNSKTVTPISIKVKYFIKY